MNPIVMILFGFIFIIEIHSQNYTVSKCDTCAVLNGKVTDADTKEPLIGANVVLVADEIGAATNVDDNFIVRDIKPGLYNIKCSYTGYSKKIIENVLLKPGEIRTINFELPDYGEEFSLQADEDIKNGDVKILIGGLPVFCVPFDEVNDLCSEFGFRYELMGCSSAVKYIVLETVIFNSNSADEIKGV